MLGGILIDDRGRLWPESSRELVRRIGYRDPAMGIPEYAVRRGLIHIRPHRGGMQVSVGAGLYGVSTLASALYALQERAPGRILLSVLSGDEWNYAMCATVADVAAHAESLVKSGELNPRPPWFAVERDLRALSAARFDAVRPLTKLWFDQRGRWSQDLLRAMAAGGIAERVICARQRRGSARLTCEHFGAGIRMLKPCETFLALGRDVAEVPDRAYGGWVADAYAAAIHSRHIQMASVRATIRTWEADARVHYDRLLIPWRDRGDMMVLAVSMRRAFSLTA